MATQMSYSNGGVYTQPPHGYWMHYQQFPYYDHTSNYNYHHDSYNQSMVARFPAPQFNFSNYSGPGYPPFNSQPSLDFSYPGNGYIQPTGRQRAVNSSYNQPIHYAQQGMNNAQSLHRTPNFMQDTYNVAYPGIVSNSYSDRSVSHSVGSASHSVGNVSHSVSSVSRYVGSVNHSVGNVNNSVGSASHASSVSYNTGSVRHTAGRVNNALGSVSHNASSVTHNAGSDSHVVGGGSHTVGGVKDTFLQKPGGVVDTSPQKPGSSPRLKKSLIPVLKRKSTCLQSAIQQFAQGASKKQRQQNTSNHNQPINLSIKDGISSQEKSYNTQHSTTVYSNGTCNTVSLSGKDQTFHQETSSNFLYQQPIIAVNVQNSDLSVSANHQLVPETPCSTNPINKITFHNNQVTTNEFLDSNIVSSNITSNTNLSAPPEQVFVSKKEQPSPTINTLTSQINKTANASQNLVLLNNVPGNSEPNMVNIVEPAQLLDESTFNLLSCQPTQSDDSGAEYCQYITYRLCDCVKGIHPVGDRFACYCGESPVFFDSWEIFNEVTLQKRNSRSSSSNPEKDLLSDSSAKNTKNSSSVEANDANLAFSISSARNTKDTLSIAKIKNPKLSDKNCDKNTKVKHNGVNLSCGVKINKESSDKKVVKTTKGCTSTTESVTVTDMYGVHPDPLAQPVSNVGIHQANHVLPLVIKRKKGRFEISVKKPLAKLSSSALER